MESRQKTTPTMWNMLMCFARVWGGLELWNLVIFHIFCYRMFRKTFLSRSMQAFSPICVMLHCLAILRTTTTYNTKDRLEDKEHANLYFQNSERNGDRFVCDSCDTSALLKVGSYASLRRLITGRYYVEAVRSKMRTSNANEKCVMLWLTVFCML